MEPFERYKYEAYMGLYPKVIPHWEFWSNPDAESYITGMDYYEKPRSVRLKMKELYPDLELKIPDQDTPIVRPEAIFGDKSSFVDKDGNLVVRWGDSFTTDWEHGKGFATVEDVLAFSPLENLDYRGRISNEAFDYRDEEALYQMFRARFPKEWNCAPAGSPVKIHFYNTMFMWPLITFGWNLFLEACLEEEFERIMDEFAEISRRVFRAFARLPVNFVVCHDDIVMTKGPVCSPSWMRKYIFPRYEEFWGILKAAGKQVIFMSDGNMDSYADDVMACGAIGIVSEPYTDFKTIAKRHKDCFLAGEGDNRILMTGNRDAIKKMVDTMVETAQLTGGYMMSVGNHIPWNVPADAVKYYLEYCEQAAVRK